MPSTGPKDERSAKEWRDHMLTKSPTFMFSYFGTDHHLPGTKSDLLHCLEQPDQPEPPSAYCCKVFDGAVIVHCLPVIGINELAYTRNILALLVTSSYCTLNLFQLATFNNTRVVFEVRRVEYEHDDRAAKHAESYRVAHQYIHNTAARLITRTRKHDHITPVIRTLHWLLIPQRIQFKILLLTFNIIHHRAPSYLIELISPKQTTGMNLRSSSRPQLALGPRTHNRYGDRAFSVCAPTLWNTLPAHIQDSPTIDIFKKNLKTHLFQKQPK
ncbi:uncharacterized protein LOC115921225 [Strongylocentrotus purpuratus]|uniref:Uncharacterized protein n=1 Tax=Strongylocentrotus purpuratus TaxID=7668 RepID=A0A7M7SVJ6_STRPU|nr:uncharacterized protein LOC115921225 [Strongylocentrotus purpuratus]